MTRGGAVAAATKTRGGTENAASIYTTGRGSANFPAVQHNTTKTDIIILLALKTETIMAIEDSPNSTTGRRTTRFEQPFAKDGRGPKLKLK